MSFLGLISSDAALSHAIGEQLKLASGGWQQAVFASLEDALGAWSETLPPLILWDVEDSPASEELISFFAAKLLHQKPAPFVLVLGPPPAALEAFGAAEVLSRPLRIGYLLMRLQFYQRRLQLSPDRSFGLGPWLFTPASRGLMLSDTDVAAVKLTEKEAELLEYLCAATQPVSRDELLATIWGYDTTIDTHTLETHIYRLRRKIMTEATAGMPDVFQSDPGGYAVAPAWRER